MSIPVNGFAVTSIRFTVHTYDNDTNAVTFDSTVEVASGTNAGEVINNCVTAAIGAIESVMNTAYPTQTATSLVIYTGVK